MFEYQWIQLGFQAIYLIGIFAIALPKKFKIKELYNYSTKVEEMMVDDITTEIVNA